MSAPVENIVPDLLICARKTKKLTQSEVSKHLKIHQSTYSRIELGQLIPSVYEWATLSDFLDMPMDSINDGFLDKETLTEIRSETCEYGLPLPKRYRNLRCFKVRYILPLIQFIKEEFGGQSFEKMVTALGLDTYFFTSLDNQLNLNFLDDCFDFMSKNFNFSETSIPIMASYIIRPRMHGHLAKQYLQENDDWMQLLIFIKNLPKYERIFNYDIVSLNKDEKIFRVAITANKELASSFDKCAPITIKYVEIMREKSFQLLPMLQGSSKAPASQKEATIVEKRTMPSEILYDIKAS